MAADFLDRVLQGTGLTTKPTDESIEKARDFQLGNQIVNPGMGMGPTNTPGGLIPAYELMEGQREDYLAEFGGERQRILNQVATNRVGQNRFNQAATGALPALTEGATPEGFLARIREISTSPELQAVVDRENQFRQRAATSALAAGGLTRSGAAAQAAADATLTPEERAFQIEPALYGRSQQLANMYRDLPIANMMVADTYNRDMMLADNLLQQGVTRSQAELLKGQASKEATENMLLNLIKAYGAATGGGGINIVNDITNSFEDLIGDIVARGGDAVSGLGEWVGGILDSIFDGGDGDVDLGDDVMIPPFVLPPTGTPNPGDSPLPDPGGGPSPPGGTPTGDVGFYGREGDPNVPALPDPLRPDRSVGGVAARWNPDLGRWVEIPPSMAGTFNPGPDQPGQAQPPAPAPAPEPEPDAGLPPLEPAPAPPVETMPPMQGDVPDFLENPQETYTELQNRNMVDDQGYIIDFQGRPTNIFWTDWLAQARDAFEGARPGTGEPPLGELPPLTPPDLEGGIRDPGQEGEDLIGNIGGNIGVGDIFDAIRPGGGNLGIGSGFAPQPGSGGVPAPISLPNLATVIASEITGYGGREIGEALFDRKATTSWGSTIGSGIGFAAGGPVGALIGSALGGLADSAFGTSDQKNVTVGVATTQPGDDISGQMVLPSGLNLWGINRRGGDGGMTGAYMNTIAQIDEFLTETANAAGFDVALSNDGFGGEVQGKGKNLKKNPTFFGSATEGSEESDRAHITRNLTEGYDKFIDAWLRAAVDQGQITGPEAGAVQAIEGNSTEKLLAFQEAMGFTPIRPPDTPTPPGSPGIGNPGQDFELPGFPIGGMNS